MSTNDFNIEIESIKNVPSTTLLEKYKKYFVDLVKTKEGKKMLKQYIEDLKTDYEKAKLVIKHWKEYEMSDQAKTIQEERYLWKEYHEDWEMLSKRVARVITSSLTTYFTDEVIKELGYDYVYNVFLLYEQMFFDILSSRIQLPNTPALINAGLTRYRRQGNLEREKYLLYAEKISIDEYKELYENLDRTYQYSQCNVLDVDDSIESILDQFNKSTLISKGGGGIGLNFGKLRYKNQRLSNGGVSSGSVSFIYMFNSMLQTIKQGGKNRRGAGMQTHGFGNLKNKDFWKEPFSIHPDALEFIDAKKENKGTNQLANFNISFAINNTKDFVEKYEKNEYVDSVFDNQIYEKNKIKVRELLRKLATNAHKTADPGLIFLDKINHFNQLRNILPILSVNVCGEIPIIQSQKYGIIGSCNLMSINLFAFLNKDNIILEIPNEKELFGIKQKYYRFSELKSVVRIVYEFLDFMLDLLAFPLEDSSRGQMLLRNVGIGFTSLAGTLAWLNIPYDHELARTFAKNVMLVLEVEGFKQSVKKQKIFGNYLLFDEYADKEIMPDAILGHINEQNYEVLDDIHTYLKGELIDLVSELKKYRRNIFVTTMQPSGTVGLLMQTKEFEDVGQGIEPFFQLSYVRKYRENNTENFKELKYYNKILTKKLEKINNNANIDINNLPSNIKDVFKTALQIDYLDHLKMLEAVQMANSQAISKTINLPRNQTIEDVEKQFLYAIKSKYIKGVTIYRDGSLETQILNVEDNIEEKDKSMSNNQEKHSFIILNEQNKIVPKERKDSLPSVTRKVQTQDGKMYITVSFDNGELQEVFISNGSEIAEVLGRFISMSLRAGLDISEILNQLKKVQHGNGYYSQIVYKTINQMLKDQQDYNISKKYIVEKDIVRLEQGTEEIDVKKLKKIDGVYIDDEGNIYCPSCLSKNSIIKGEGCTNCSNCGWSKCS